MRSRFLLALLTTITTLHLFGSVAFAVTDDALDAQAPKPQGCTCTGSLSASSSDIAAAKIVGYDVAAYCAQAKGTFSATTCSNLKVVTQATDAASCTATTAKSLADSYGVPSFVQDKVTTTGSCGWGDLDQTTPTVIQNTQYVEAQVLQASKEEQAKIPPKPIKPRLQIDIPNLTFTDPEDLALVENAGGQQFVIPYIGQYINGVFNYAIGLLAFIAVMSIVVAGFMWATAGGNASRIDAAKETVSRALIGLTLLLGSYTILYIIDPELTNLNPVNLTTVQTEEFELLQDVPPPLGAQVTQQDVAAAGVSTAGLSACPSDPAAAKANPSLIKPCVPCDLVGAPNSPLVKVPKGPGLKINGTLYTSPAVAAGLSKAGTIAAQSGYVIFVKSTCRTYKGQLDIWTPEKQKSGQVAPPGSSNHGTGMAADVQLMKDGKPLTSMSFSKQCTQDLTTLKTLADIMFAAGFHRYMPEIWHYEIGTKIDGKYRMKSAARPTSCN